MLVLCHQGLAKLAEVGDSDDPQVKEIRDQLIGNIDAFLRVATNISKDLRDALEAARDAIDKESAEDARARAHVERKMGGAAAKYAGVRRVGSTLELGPMTREQAEARAAEISKGSFS